MSVEIAGRAPTCQPILLQTNVKLRHLYTVWGVPLTLQFWDPGPAQATTKGLSQIVTTEMLQEGELSLSLQIQDKKIAKPYQVQAEMGLTEWGEIAVFKGFDPNELIFGTEIGLLTKEPYLLLVGFVNRSPHSDVDPQPLIEAGYYGTHHKFIVGASHAGYKNEAVLGYATISMRPGGHKSIGKAALRIHRRLDLSVT